MFGQRIDLFRAFGIPIRIDLSWFLVAVLVTWSLAENVLPQIAPGGLVPQYWLWGLVATLGMFTSIIIHELAHALVARRYAMPIRGITLFIFGGVAEMESEPPNAAAEFFVAIAGPIASVVLGVGGLGLAAVAAVADLPAGWRAVVAVVAWINLVLVVFNMIPAFPLDGGRVLRSALWHWRGDLRWATRITSWIGGAFGIFLVAFGVWKFIVHQDLIGGLWMALIGMFLRNAARMSYQQLEVRRALEGEPVGRFMQTDPIVVSRAMPIAELVESYVYRYHFKMFPVVDGERLVGCVTTRKVRETPREEWPRQSVGSITDPCAGDNTIAPDADALEALARMSRSGASRLMVVEDDRLVGILALKDLLRFLALKVELEGPAPKKDSEPGLE